jgi:hypothetical protein
MASKWPLEPWAVSILGTSSGPVAHLVEDQLLHADVKPRSLCGVKASSTATTSFKVDGCKRCCKAALTAGLTSVIDVNGEVHDVRTLLTTPRVRVEADDRHHERGRTWVHRHRPGLRGRPTRRVIPARCQMCEAPMATKPPGPPHGVEPLRRYTPLQIRRSPD